MTNNVLMQ